ncbi:MAG: peptidoglycan DD-metalloendopeptidase family protein [Synergistaceae bacterium]|nr:peptidoglycan DD-metalloendopeptidase family protein [Synergistaceae bacterium]
MKIAAALPTKTANPISGDIEEAAEATNITAVVPEPANPPPRDIEEASEAMNIAAVVPEPANPSPGDIEEASVEMKTAAVVPEPTNPAPRDIEEASEAMNIAAVVPEPVNPAPGDIEEASETTNIAAIVPKPVNPSRGDIEEAAAVTVSSVREILNLMRQAQALSSMLPPQKQTAATEPKSEPETAILLASRTPNVPKPATAKKTEPAPEKSKASLPGSKKLIWPVEGNIYSAFNATRGRRKHGAIDIVTKKGVPIAAAADGIVSVASNGGKGFRGYGKIVILDHGKGLYTLYAHCDKLLVKIGQRVKAGEYIATVGRTGRATTNHCHFEVRISGKKYDPLVYLPSRPDLVKATNYHTPKKRKR